MDWNFGSLILGIDISWDNLSPILRPRYSVPHVPDNLHAMQGHLFLSDVSEETTFFFFFERDREGFFFFFEVKLQFVRAAGRASNNDQSSTNGPDCTNHAQVQHKVRLNFSPLGDVGPWNPFRLMGYWTIGLRLWPTQLRSNEKKLLPKINIFFCKSPKVNIKWRLGQT